MNKNQVLKKINSFGDAILDFNNWGKESIVCTIDLSTKYIKQKMRKGKRIKRNRNSVYAWSWTDDELIEIDPTRVIRITPLAKILDNKE